jgi:hypothetical protein
MQSASVGIRDAKMHLSKYLKMVQQGTEVIIKVFILKKTRIHTSRILLMGLILIPFIAANFSYAAESELTLEQILDRVEKHYTGKSFQAEFIQESTIKAMDIVDVASGKIFVRYPGMMRW